MLTSICGFVLRSTYDSLILHLWSLSHVRWVMFTVQSYITRSLSKSRSLAFLQQLRQISSYHQLTSKFSSTSKLLLKLSSNPSTTPLSKKNSCWCLWSFCAPVWALCKRTVPFWCDGGCWSGHPLILDSLNKDTWRLHTHCEFQPILTTCNSGFISSVLQKNFIQSSPHLYLRNKQCQYSWGWIHLPGTINMSGHWWTWLRFNNGICMIQRSVFCLY